MSVQVIATEYFKQLSGSQKRVLKAAAAGKAFPLIAADTDMSNAAVERIVNQFLRTVDCTLEELPGILDSITARPAAQPAEASVTVDPADEEEQPAPRADEPQAEDVPMSEQDPSSYAEHQADENPPVNATTGATLAEKIQHHLEASGENISAFLERSGISWGAYRGIMVGRNTQLKTRKKIEAAFKGKTVTTVRISTDAKSPPAPVETKPGPIDLDPTILQMVSIVCTAAEKSGNLDQLLRAVFEKFRTAKPDVAREFVKGILTRLLPHIPTEHRLAFLLKQHEDLR